jgi:hypothetical protein
MPPLARSAGPDIFGQHRRWLCPQSRRQGSIATLTWIKPDCELALSQDRREFPGTRHKDEVERRSRGPGERTPYDGGPQYGSGGGDQFGYGPACSYARQAPGCIRLGTSPVGTPRSKTAHKK